MVEPLDHVAGRDVRDDRADHRRNVQRPVLVEAVILDRQNRLLRDIAHLVEVDDLAVLVQVDRGEHRLAIVGVDRGAFGERRDPLERVS
jgi:hypothetical protein